MALSLGDLIEIAMVSLLDGVDEQINVYHYKLATALDTTEVSMVADFQAKLGDAYAGIAPFIPPNIKFVELRFRNVTDDGPTLFYPTDFSPSEGTSGGDMLPPACSALVLYRTAVKRVLGRKYLPTMVEAHQSFGQWSEGVMDALEIFGADTGVAFDGDTSGNNWAPHVYSRELATSYPIISTQARPQVAYMRTRRIGRGS